jgi:hypothetical protein
MSLSRGILATESVVALAGTIGMSTLAAEASDTAVDTPREYSVYEKFIRKNVPEFHASFDVHEFTKNGELVAERIHADSNGVMVEGRSAFADRIARFVGPFPDIGIQDVVTIVDGNRASVRDILTGTRHAQTYQSRWR